MSLLTPFQSSSIYIEGYSPSINLDWENDVSSANQDDSSGTKKPWGLVQQAVSEMFDKPSLKVGLSTHEESCDSCDAGSAQPSHHGPDVSYLTTGFAPTLEKQELEITMLDENSRTCGRSFVLKRKSFLRVTEKSSWSKNSILKKRSQI